MWLNKTKLSERPLKYILKYESWEQLSWHNFIFPSQNNNIFSELQPHLLKDFYIFYNKKSSSSPYPFLLKNKQISASSDWINDYLVFELTDNLCKWLEQDEYINLMIIQTKHWYLTCNLVENTNECKEYFLSYYLKIKKEKGLKNMLDVFKQNNIDISNYILHSTIWQESIQHYTLQRDQLKLDEHIQSPIQAIKNKAYIYLWLFEWERWKKQKYISLIDFKLLYENPYPINSCFNPIIEYNVPNLNKDNYDAYYWYLNKNLKTTYLIQWEYFYFIWNLWKEKKKIVSFKPKLFYTKQNNSSFILWKKYYITQIYHVKNKYYIHVWIKNQTKDFYSSRFLNYYCLNDNNNQEIFKSKKLLYDYIKLNTEFEWWNKSVIVLNYQADDRFHKDNQAYFQELINNSNWEKLVSFSNKNISLQKDIYDIIESYFQQNMKYDLSYYVKSSYYNKYNLILYRTPFNNYMLLTEWINNSYVSIPTRFKKNYIAKDWLFPKDIVVCYDDNERTLNRLYPNKKENHVWDISMFLHWIAELKDKAMYPIAFVKWNKTMGNILNMKWKNGVYVKDFIQD